ncbi:MAG: hypothetical protein KGJ62_08955 [Armatimonadetes bacterium]|nr:hypothetical protein [Armatimonadota bacterium]MDE2206453.1 hypothetical protein [Armatimonadota bacterium]
MAGGTLLTPRSRRLRTIGAVLLGAIIVLAAIGAIYVGPLVHHVPAAVLASPAARKKKLLGDVAILYSWWGLVTGLVILLLIVAWLDVREVARSYMEHRQSLWSEYSPTRHDDDAGPTS